MTDLVLAGYPIVVFWNLQMPRRLKVGLCLLMGMGIFSCACACLKTFQIAQVNQVQDRTGQYTSELDQSLRKALPVAAQESVAHKNLKKRSRLSFFGLGEWNTSMISLYSH